MRRMILHRQGKVTAMSEFRLTDVLWLGVIVLCFEALSRFILRPKAEVFGAKVYEILNYLYEKHASRPHGALLKRGRQRVRESSAYKWAVDRVSLFNGVCVRLKGSVGAFTLQMGKQRVVLAACILAIGILFSGLFPRYQVTGIGEDGEFVRRFDKWTGQVCIRRVLGTEDQWERGGTGWRCI